MLLIFWSQIGEDRLSEVVEALKVAILGVRDGTSCYLLLIVCRLGRSILIDSGRELVAGTWKRWSGSHSWEVGDPTKVPSPTLSIPSTAFEDWAEGFFFV